MFSGGILARVNGNAFVCSLLYAFVGSTFFLIFHDSYCYCSDWTSTSTHINVYVITYLDGFALDSMLKLDTALGGKIIYCCRFATALQIESGEIGPMALPVCNLIIT